MPEDAKSSDTIDPREVIAAASMHWRQVIAVALATALNALDGFDVLSISFAAPGIAADWHVDRAALGLVLSMELIGMAVGAIALGVFADRVGRRPTILSSLVIMASGMALAALSRDLLMLSAVRLFTGLGIGGMLAATNAVASECANVRRRALAVVIMAGGYPVGAIVGGTVGTILLATTGRWQTIFAFGSIATLLFIPLALLFLPETLAFVCARQPSNSLARANRELGRFGHPPVAYLPAPDSFSSRGVVGEAFAHGRAPTTLLLVTAYFFHIMTFYFFMKWVPKLVTDMGFASARAGAVLVWANVGGAFGALTLSLLTRHVQVRSLVIAAMLGGAVAVAAFGQDVGSLALLSGAAAAAGFFTNGATAGLYAVIAERFPARLRAGGTGLVIGVGRGGAALGPIIGGALLSQGWPLAVVAPTLASGCACGALALAILGRLDARTRVPLEAG